MPLLDHFHAPLAPRRSWESFHSLWCGAILDQLNQILPDRFFGEVNIHLGPSAIPDVAEFDAELFAAVPSNGAEGGVAVAPWAPPAATATIETVFPDELEVQIIDTREGSVLVAVIELVSPSNEESQETRDAFAAKCAAYLQRGVGLVVVDVVSKRHFNLHNLLMVYLGQEAEAHMPPDAHLYATAYRPFQRQKKALLDIWTTALSIGQPLPTLPLALRGSGCVPLDLEASYTATRARCRI